MSDPNDTSPTPTVGAIAWDLREAAGLTRRQLGEQTGVAIETIRNFETGRCRPTAWTMLRLLTSPAMGDLPKKAQEAGLVLDLPTTPGERGDS